MYRIPPMSTNLALIISIYTFGADPTVRHKSWRAYLIIFNFSHTLVCLLSWFAHHSSRSNLFELSPTVSQIRLSCALSIYSENYTVQFTLLRSIKTLNMAPTKSKKRGSNSSNAPRTAMADTKVPLRAASPSTPQRSPIRKQKQGITIRQKQALIDNLQLESEHPYSPK